LVIPSVPPRLLHVVPAISRILQPLYISTFTCKPTNQHRSQRHKPKQETLPAEASPFQSQYPTPLFSPQEPFSRPRMKPSSSTMQEKNLGGRGVGHYYLFSTQKQPKTTKQQATFVSKHKRKREKWPTSNNDGDRKVKFKMVSA
jgi:hypothetical protein